MRGKVFFVLSYRFSLTVYPFSKLDYPIKNLKTCFPQHIFRPFNICFTSSYPQFFFSKSKFQKAPAFPPSHPKSPLHKASFPLSPLPHCENSEQTHTPYPRTPWNTLPHSQESPQPQWEPPRPYQPVP